MARVVMTREGLEKLQAELEHLQKIERRDVTAALSHARSLGDLSENAEYHSAKERQALLESRIRKLQTDITNADVVDQSQVARGVAVFGRTVRVKDLAEGTEETYILVGRHEADFDSGKISVESPIGKGLLGKKTGDVAVIQVPAGTIRYQVLSID